MSCCSLETWIVKEEEEENGQVAGKYRVEEGDVSGY